MWSPFNDFPRELGLPARVGLIHNMRELVKKVNTYNSHSTVFTSLYAFDEVNEQKNRGIYSSARIKQIYLDVDEPKSTESVKALHEYCSEKDYCHTILFSGAGFHFYLATKFPNDLKNKKGAVTNSQIHIADETSLNIGVNGEFDIDGHIIGNVAQLVRIPETFNLKRKRYCIPITKEDLKLSLKEIKQKAKKQRFGLHVYGKKHFDLTPYDTEPQTKGYELDIKIGSSEKIGLDKIDPSTFPPCIQKLSSERFLSHRARFIFILYCKELGLPVGDTISLLKKVLEPKTFYHCIRQEKQPLWVYRRQDLVFPSCDKMRLEGFCPDPNCSGVNLY